MASEKIKTIPKSSYYVQTIKKDKQFYEFYTRDGELIMSIDCLENEYYSGQSKKIDLMLDETTRGKAHVAAIKITKYKRAGREVHFIDKNHHIITSMLYSGIAEKNAIVNEIKKYKDSDNFIKKVDDIIDTDYISRGFISVTEANDDKSCIIL